MFTIIVGGRGKGGGVHETKVLFRKSVKLMSEMYIIKVLCHSGERYSNKNEWPNRISSNLVENPSNLDRMRQIFLMFSGVLV